MGCVNGLAIELGEKDVGDGAEHAFRGSLEDVGQVGLDAPIAQADGGVESGEAVEANVKSGYGRAGTQHAVFLFKPTDNFRVH